MCRRIAYFRPMYNYFEITQAFSAFCKVISVLAALDFWGRKANASDLVFCERPCPKRFMLLLFVGNDKFEALSAQYGVMFPNLFHE